MTPKEISYVRRSFDGGCSFFIVNQGQINFDGWVDLRRAASVLFLNPMTGNIGTAEFSNSIPDAHTLGFSKVHLKLAAGESVIMRAITDPRVLTKAGKQFEPRAWNYWQPNGQPVEITGPWNVKFVLGGPTLPADFQTPKLASWTTFPDTNTQAFAGSAKYETMFDAPQAAGKSFEINLHNVRQSARVRVNGKDYGTLITPPFRVVVDNLKPTGNTLEVEVTSVAANRIRDLDRRGVPWKIFRDINIVNLNYKPFDASDWPLTDCGLLGPVTLTPVTSK